MTTFSKYIRAESLEQAYELNLKKRNRILGGGLWLRLGDLNLDTAVDLCDLGLNRIEEDDEFFRIGACVTLRQLETDRGLSAYTGGALSEALKNIVGVQFRNMATVGGSVYGRFGFSDVLTFLLSADSCVELYRGGEGGRTETVSLSDFSGAARNPKNGRDPAGGREDQPYAGSAKGEILTHVLIRKTPSRFAYRSVRLQSTDFPVLTCASSLSEAGCRTVIGARPGRAVVVPGSENLIPGMLTEENAEDFAAFAAETVPVSGNLRGSGEYRKQLVKVLTRRNLEELGGLL